MSIVKQDKDIYIKSHISNYEDCSKQCFSVKSYVLKFPCRSDTTKAANLQRSTATKKFSNPSLNGGIVSYVTFWRRNTGSGHRKRNMKKCQTTHTLSFTKRKKNLSYKIWYLKEALGQDPNWCHSLKIQLLFATKYSEHTHYFYHQFS
jgi:hypothetical protein